MKVEYCIKFSVFSLIPSCIGTQENENNFSVAPLNSQDLSLNLLLEAEAPAPWGWVGRTGSCSPTVAALPGRGGVV